MPDQVNVGKFEQLAYRVEARGRVVVARDDHARYARLTCLYKKFVDGAGRVRARIFGIEHVARDND